jgi:hypothetical protein
MSQLPVARSSRAQAGQALILLALAFIGLAAFVGLTVDAGILFANIGHLRRAVDAASLAAAGQFREGRTAKELSDMALQVIELNGLNPSSAVAKVCDREGGPTSPYDDPTLCPGGKNPPPEPLPESYRKFVRVQADLPVYFAFLPIIGWDTVTIRANAVSEAASVDIVLAIDTSDSMAYDAACDDGDDDDGDGAADDCAPAQYGWPGAPDSPAPGGWDVPDDYMRNPDFCNPGDECHPFREVRENAKLLVERTYFPYDRIGVVTFDREAKLVLSLEDGTTEAVVNSALDAMAVYDFPGCPGFPPDPRGCTSTNIADGLRLAGREFCRDKNADGDCLDINLGEMRPEAVWIVVLLTDGAANAAIDDKAPPKDPERWLCPGLADSPTWVEPFCRDDRFEVGVGAFGFDAEDAAESMALFVGCPNPDLPQPAGCPAAGGQGAVIFTIGLGDQVTENTTCNPAAYPGGCQADAGERFLRYVAAIGDDGNPGTDDCAGIPSKENCGNYYFAQEGLELEEIFEAIASRIFTRITH